MADSLLPPVKPRLPGRPPGAPVLALARRSMRARLSADGQRLPSGPTMNPLAAPSGATQWDEVSAELAASLRQWEAALLERECHLQDAEARVAERERELAEAAALWQARAHLQAVAMARPRPRSALTPEEHDALEVWRAELERQEATLREDKAALREREAYLEESENRLLDKVQAQQELETELEQRAEDLGARTRAWQREGDAEPAKPDPWREFVE